MEYQLVPTVLGEVRSSIRLELQLTQLIAGFIKFLKEPRFQQPLTIIELSTIFSGFYRDLNCLIVGFYTSSNSIKKSLIKDLNFFNANPDLFDYLLTIANNTQGSIQKRQDNAALHQLRIFNFYKFITIFESIELAHKTLFESLLDDATLYDKVFKFDQRDLIHEEFLYEKIELLKLEKLSFSQFGVAKFSDFIDEISTESIDEMNKLFLSLDSTTTPFSKLSIIVEIHKYLIQLFINAGYKNLEVNNDILLPSLIYLIIYKLDTSSIYSNFLFIKNFLNMLDPHHIELYTINPSSGYQPSEKVNKLGRSYKSSGLFDLLLINSTFNTTDEIDEKLNFFDNDKSLINYISNNYLNNGELNYYLTNFEAIITFLSNITLEELTGVKSEHELLDSTLYDLVQQDLKNHFKFPEPKVENDIEEGDEVKKVKEKELDKEKSDKNARSRSSSILASLTTKFQENRTRSSSSIASNLRSNTQESFPSISSVESDLLTHHDNGLSVSLVKNLFGRFNSMNVPQISHEKQEKNGEKQENTTQEDEVVNDLASGINSIGSEESNGNSHTIDNNSIYSHQNSFSSHTNSINLTPRVKNVNFVDLLSPNHLRTRSSSIEQMRGSITSKLTNGVNEFMTKINNNNNNNNNNNTGSLLINKSNGSSSSFESIEDSTVTLKQKYNRSRNASLQIMDRWFNHISANIYHTNANGAAVTKDLKELTRFKDVDFDSLTIKDMKVMKHYYDIMCQQSLQLEEEYGDDAEDTVLGETIKGVDGSVIKD